MKSKKMVFVLAVMFFLAWSPTSAQDEEQFVDKIEIGKMKCKELMAGSDSERDIGIAYYHGYMDGKKNVTTLDIAEASAVSDHVRDFCLSNPASTVMEAFAKLDKPD